MTITMPKVKPGPGLRALPERIVAKVAGHGSKSGTSRRGFIGGAALIGAALAADPWSYLVRPASAYASICGSDASCASGYTAFCCSINGGNNTCPPDSFVGGWWKADNSSFCGGSARYYIDCNAYRDGHYSCHCNSGSCDERRVACNQFRYGQCNLQIPYSNTGPVLCRVISCTPPWVQFAGTCSTSSATDNNTANHNAPCLDAHPPKGAVESISADGNTVHITGWAYDPNKPIDALAIAVHVNGKAAGRWTTTIARPDVNKAHGITGNHGFKISLPASNGVHTFQVYAINVGPTGPNPLLATKSLNINPVASPRGRLDSLTVNGNTVHVRGWAYDPDQSGTSLQLAVSLDGVQVASATANVARPDVDKAFGISGAHGFDLDINAANGPHNLHIVAINAGRPAANTLIVNQSLIANPGQAPVGNVDAITAANGTVRITGWAYDPDEPAGTVVVSIQSGSDVVGHFPANISRPDVNQTFGITGNHGFDITLAAATGLYSYSVYALNLGGGTVNPLLGTSSVTVNAKTPIGAMDSVDVMGSVARIQGWTFDPDRPAASMQVTVHVDGAAIGNYNRGVNRPDIDSAYKVSGHHGYDISINLTPGTHTVAVYAVNVPGGTNPMLGSTTVTVA